MNVFGKFAHLFAVGVAIASVTTATAYAATSNSPVHYGAIQFSYTTAAGSQITEIRTINMDLYVASGGSNIDPILRPQQSICNPPELPPVVGYGPQPPPPSSLDWSVGTIDIIQDPISGGGGSCGWHRRYTYQRPIHQQPRSVPLVWGEPGPWGPPLIRDFQGSVTNADCNLNPS